MLCRRDASTHYLTIDANSRLFVVPRHIDAYDRRVEQIINPPRGTALGGAYYQS